MVAVHHSLFLDLAWSLLLSYSAIAAHRDSVECHVDPYLLRLRPLHSSSVCLPSNTIVTRRHGAGVSVRAGAVVFVLCIETMARVQYVVGMFGLTREPPMAACGGIVCIRGSDGAASRVSPTAWGSILVLAPCGLGLVPISFIVQNYAFLGGEAKA